MTEPRPACRCGHPAEVHDHHHPWRSDCGRCGHTLCSAYRPENGILRDLATGVATRIRRARAWVGLR